MDNPPHILHK